MSNKTVAVTASNLCDSAQNKISNATISFQPVLSNGEPTSYRMSGSEGGPATNQPITAQVTNGAFDAINLPDCSQTFPAWIGFAVTVTSNLTGKVLLQQGYTCVQPSSEPDAAIWCATDSNGNTTGSLDLYPTNLGSQTSVQTGPPGVSAYQVYTAAGGQLSETNWLASLVGPQGPQGSQGVPGSTTATGSNGAFDVPGPLTNQSQVANQTVVFNPAPSPGSSYDTVDQTNSFLTATGSGVNVGAGVNGAGWTILHSISRKVTTAVRGIKQIAGYILDSRGVGDTAMIYGYLYSVGGAYASADEAQVGASFQIAEHGDYFRGTVTSTTGAGDVQPVLASQNYPNYASGRDFTSDGTILLNISKGTIAGALTGSSTQLPGTSLNQLPVTITAGGTGGGATLPLTTAWAILSQPVIVPVAPAQTTQSVTVNVQVQPIAGVYTPLVPGVVSFGGREIIEQVRIVSVGAMDSGTHIQSVTMLCKYNNSGGVLFQGGIAGQYISADAQLNMSATPGQGKRTSYFALGSIDGTHLVYAVNFLGDTGRTILPRYTSEAWQTSGPNAGFHLYPGAEIVANSTLGAVPTLEINQVAWAVGDIVENPHASNFLGSPLKGSIFHDTPSDSQFDSPVLNLTMGGYGVSGSNNGITIDNQADLNQFQTPGTGVLTAPRAIYTSGRYDVYLQTQYLCPPLQDNVSGLAVIECLQLLPGQDGTKAVNVIKLPNGRLAYTPSTGTFNFGNLSIDNATIYNLTCSNVQTFMGYSIFQSNIYIQGTVNIGGAAGQTPIPTFNGDMAIAAGDVLHIRQGLIIGKN